MDYNSPIHGLVTRDSYAQRIRKTHWGAGFVKAAGILVVQGLYAATKPKARSPMGFLLSSRPPVCGTSVVQGGLSSYTSTPELERRAKARSGWYVGRLRVCARSCIKSGQRYCDELAPSEYESGHRFTTVRLRFAQNFTIGIQR